MYFHYLPKMTYDPVGNGNGKYVTNILKRARIRTNVKKELVMLDKYDVQELETPEIVADKHHGSVYYHWVVMLVNNISDVNHDWVKSTRQLQKYLQSKYTEAQLTEAHHYEIPQSSGDTTVNIQVPQGTSDAVTITNYEYETALNESKREIDLLRNEYLEFFVEEFDELI